MTRRSVGRKTKQRANARQRVTTYRKRMREMGYRPVEVWVPDTRNRRFRAAFEKQCRLISATERNDAALEGWLDANAAELSATIDRTEESSGAPEPSWGPEHAL